MWTAIPGKPSTTGTTGTVTAADWGSTQGV
jgi:hypothetical protein